jgi:hypothetical protein
MRQATKDLVHVPRSPVVPEPPIQVTASDMAWMAGVVDLKAAMLRKNNQTRKTTQFVLYVQTKNERIAQRLSALTGISPEPHTKAVSEAFIRRGCAEHCITPHVHVNDPYPWRMPPTTRWALTGVAAAVVLANLAPFMTTYDDYAGDVREIVRDFAADGQGSGAVHKALSRLSALGWQIPPSVLIRLAAASEESA